MSEPVAPRRPALNFRTSRGDLAQASAGRRLLMVAPVLALVWVILALLVQA